MTTTNRAALINKTYKVVKRTYKHTPVKGDQPLFESLLFACVLENARHDVAQAAFVKVRGAFFDWNEIRVSTVKELGEVMDSLPDPMAAAARLKGVLQSVFESDYSFDLEHLKKQNIGAAVKRLQKLQGSTPFNVAYVTQISLGGHSIPIDKGASDALYVLGVVSESDAKNCVVPGLERAIPKSKGQEFGGLLHELGAEFFANPFSNSVRDLLLSIASDARDRFPKRTPKKPVEPPAPPAKVAVADVKKKGKEPIVVKKPAKPGEKHALHGAKAAAAHPKKKAAGAAKKASPKQLPKRKPR